jgi:FkbM family methyltransferase
MKTALRRLAVSNLRLYALARTAVRRLPFMLPHELDFYGLAMLANDTGVFLDVGANDGLSALSMHRLKPRKPILSIEPNPIHRTSLEPLRVEIPGFDYLICGAGAEPGTLTLYTPSVDGYALTNYTSFSPDAVRANIDYHMRMPTLSQRVTMLSHTVEVKQLDSLELQTDLVKIDVEGAEAGVVQGLMRTIARCRPAFMVEYNAFSHAGVSDLFRNHNYGCFRYEHSRKAFAPFAGSAPFPLNLFWLPSERKVG